MFRRLLFHRLGRYVGAEREDSESEDRPEDTAVFDQVDVHELPITSERIREAISELDRVADNGGALIRKFQIIDKESVFDSNGVRPGIEVFDLLRKSDFLEDFLCSSELNDSIGGLHTVGGFSGTQRTEAIDWGSAFETGYPLWVDGYLAWLLTRGGAYTAFDGTYAEAKELGRQFERAVVDDRYESFFWFRLADIQWSEWFRGICHWDETLILVDHRLKVIWLVMFTSTD